MQIHGRQKAVTFGKEQIGSCGKGYLELGFKPTIFFFFLFTLCDAIYS